MYCVRSFQRVSASSRRLFVSPLVLNNFRKSTASSSVAMFSCSRVLLQSNASVESAAVIHKEVPLTTSGFCAPLGGNEHLSFFVQVRLKFIVGNDSLLLLL